MQMCLYLGMSLCCKHPFVMEYVWNTLIIKVLPQTAEDMLSFPILFSYFLTSDLTLSSFRRIILISSWKTYKIILICSVKLIFAHKIPHKPLICKTPGVLTKLPKVTKKTQNKIESKDIFVTRGVLCFPFKWPPHFWRLHLCSSGGSQTTAMCDPEQGSAGDAYNKTLHQHSPSGSRDTKLAFQK